MAQYQVPQFIDIEDRIIGPLTLKQFLYLAFAGAVLFAAWFLFKFFIWIIIAIPIVALALAFAFLKINDRPFVYFFLSALSYFLKPKLYLFGAAPKMVKEAPIEKPMETKIPEPTKEFSQSKLKELALSLDTKK